MGWASVDAQRAPDALGFVEQQRGAGRARLIARYQGNEIQRAHIDTQATKDALPRLKRDVGKTPQASFGLSAGLAFGEHKFNLTESDAPLARHR